MASLGGPIVDCTPLLERLEGYSARPSLSGMTWAHNNWHDPQAVADRISTLAKERKLKLGKGKAVVCAVLGAALVAAQRNKHMAQHVEGETIKSLQDLVGALQEQLGNETRHLSDQLTAERVTNQRLHTALTEALERERILRERLDEIRSPIVVENSDADSDEGKNPKPLYPLKDLDRIKEIFSLGEGAVMRPLIKTETVDGGQGGPQQVTTRIIPYSPTDLGKIQEKYSRGPRETETEYVWRVSLTGGDRILLSEDEARGYWGPGVFLTTNDNREPWSLTQRVAYWAGGLDPMERGDPFSIKTPTAGHILESVQKTACLQLMHDRLLVPQQPSPMQYVADPDRLHPLIRGLPDALKLYAVQLQDRLRAPRPQRRGAPPETTWGEVAQELINYRRRMGFTGQGETKSKADLRRVEGNGRIKAAPPKPTRPPDSKRYVLWTEGISKGIPREVMDGLPTPNLESLVKSWDKIKESPSPSNPKDFVLPSREPETIIPSAPPRETALIDLSVPESGNPLRRPQSVSRGMAGGSI